MSILKKAEIHRTALEGFKEGTFYEKYRPDYSDHFVSYVVQNLYNERNGTDYDILEVGAGTGKFTRKILDKITDHHRYLATDPLKDFLSVLEQDLPQLTTNVCSASNIPLSSCSVQNIICATCFHWFATDDSVREMARVLVPGGRLFLVWLTRDFNVEWVKKMEEVLTFYYDGTPRKIMGGWKKVFENCRAFKCVEHVDNVGTNLMKGNKTFMLNHFMSISVIVRLDIEEKLGAEQKFRTVLDSYFTDDEKIELPLISEYYCTEKV